MPTTYPIHPGDRLENRIVSVLTSDLLDLDAFTGFLIQNERSNVEATLPYIGVNIAESNNMPPRSPVWHLRVSITMVEDRADANKDIAGDDRPRHEIRAENMSARLFGKWNDETLADSINAINDNRGVYVLKVYAPLVSNMAATLDEVTTQYNFTAICVSTQQ